jgi:hypothetical protein
MSATALNLVEAGKLVGLGKSAVLRAIRNGRISASRNEAGGWCIEPAELTRVYPPVAGNRSDEPAATDGEPSELRARLSDAHETIADLRRRLDAAEARLDRLLLTDQRPRRWWRFGR